MQNSDMMKRPLIEVSLGGTPAEKYPSQFTLATRMGFHATEARLLYPSDSATGIPGDEITVSLVSDGESDLYFSGVVYSAATYGKFRELLLADSYKKLCETTFAAAYRKENASSILDDILSTAGIGGRSVTCPDVKLARFSTRTIPARLCIDLLVDALKEHGKEGLVWFFDEKDTFHFGALADTGKNEGETEQFETGKNITRAGSGWIETLPRPIRHSREITVNGKTLLTIRTDLKVSRSKSRLVLYPLETAL
ncbi:MAG: hypothetical protein LBH35_00380 [Treponema sp.]|jgi:hypothetical protein|nr:hypothetical protein [Treponema sp.]